MVGSRAYFGVFAAVAMAVSAPLCGAAQTGPPVHVKKCDPVPPQTTVHYSGFAPAFYSPNLFYGPYGPDVYGHRYRGYPVSANTTTSNPTLNIHYVNVTPEPLKQIDFGLVAKGVLVAEVRDVGTFSHGAEIKHTFGLSPNVFPLGTGLAVCVPLRAVYHDGKVWTNPRLPRLNATIYH